MAEKRGLDGMGGKTGEERKIPKEGDRMGKALKKGNPW